MGAAAWVYLGGGYPNFDAAYAVVWGDQLVAGALPDYAVESAPTPHPLATAFGALAALVGERGAYDMLAVVAYVSFGALVWGAYALGRECYSWRVGVLAGLIMGTSFTVLSYTAASYFDVLTAALFFLAALLEARGRRGAPVLAVLGVAGLQRPEAWVFAAGYWLYLAPGIANHQRMRLALLVAAAPVLWTTADLVVTGDPLYAFGDTRAAAQGGDGIRASLSAAQAAHAGGGSDSVLAVTIDGLRTILRLPVLLGGLAGAVLGLACLRARSRIPLILLVVGVAAFVGLGVGGLPLVNRFLLLPAAALAIFFGVALVAWMDQPDLGTSTRRARSLRAVWITAAALLLAGFIVSLPAQADRIQRLRDEVQLRVRAVDDLQAFADSAVTEAVLRRCERVYLPNNQLIPILSYVLERTPRAFAPLPRRAPRRGAYLEPQQEVLARNAFYLRSHAGQGTPASFGRVAASRYWTLRARGCGGDRA